MNSNKTTTETCFIHKIISCPKCAEVRVKRENNSKVKSKAIKELEQQDKLIDDDISYI